MIGQLLGHNSLEQITSPRKIFGTTSTFNHLKPSGVKRLQIVQGHTGLTTIFFNFLTSGHSGAQNLVPECLNVKKLKMVG